MPINLKGKTYVQVHERVEAFREQHPMGCINTQLVNTDPVTVFAAVWIDGQDRSEQPWGTGLASAEGGMGQRGDSAVEKAETAAIGRALAMCGYGVEGGIASAEEMENYEEKKAASNGGHMVKQALEISAEDAARFEEGGQQKEIKPKTMNPANAGKPASEPQIKLIRALAEKKGVPVPDLTNLTMGEASAIIEDLKG